MNWRDLLARACPPVLALMAGPLLAAPPGPAPASQPAVQARPSKPQTYTMTINRTPRRPQTSVSPDRQSSQTYVRYPANWAEVVRRAERYGALERMEDEPTREARRKFARVLSEISFEAGVSLADAIDRIRRESGMNIVVNWPALQAVGVTEDQQVTLPRLTNISLRKVLELVLQQVTASIAGVATLDWALENGILTISTRDDLNTHLTLRVYDIGDLLVPRPTVNQGGGFGGIGGNTGGSGAGMSGSFSGTGQSTP